MADSLDDRSEAYGAIIEQAICPDEIERLISGAWLEEIWDTHMVMERSIEKAWQPAIDAYRLEQGPPASS